MNSGYRGTRRASGVGGDDLPGGKRVAAGINPVVACVVGVQNIVFRIDAYRAVNTRLGDHLHAQDEPGSQQDGEEHHAGTGSEYW